jgi:hypothetical protein
MVSAVDLEDGHAPRRFFRLLDVDLVNVSDEQPADR